MTSRHEQQQQLLQALRATGSPEAMQEADRLQETYHAREMAGLSHDVYDSAREVGEPPAGWIRGSENLELLRQAMPGLDLSDEKLRDLLKPEGSGFRAEIYLPDPAVLGPGYKPTVVFKGSANEVRMPDGSLRDTAMEDFLGNNFPQSIGLETDYYNRAMDLASELKRADVEFDLTGHSLAGGKASAAAAVTGMHAVTFNAAGLHPETAPRYARDNGNLPVYDTARLVTAWQVQGDLLNDGVQGDIRGMGFVQRERMAMLLSNTVEALQRTPGGRDLLEQRLVQGIPETSQPALRRFLDRIGEGDAAGLIRDLPEAAGERKPPLVAMTRLERELVERESRASLGELQQLGGPVLTVLAMGARGANTGAAMGQVVAEGGRLAGQGIDAAGDAARAGFSASGAHVERTYTGAGVVLNHTTQAVGEATAQARMAGAHVEAAIDRGQGWAQFNLSRARGGALRGLGEVAGVFSDAWQDGFQARADRVAAQGEAARNRNRDEADAALAQGRSDAQGRRELADAIGLGLQATASATGRGAREQLVYVGDRLDAGLDVLGGQVTRTTAHAPEVGAGLGGITGVVAGGALAFDPRTPWGAANWTGTIELKREAGPGVTESVARHGMDSAMIPSLDRHIEAQEQAARALLQRQAPPAPDVVATEARGLLSRGDAREAMTQLMSALGRGDGEAASRATRALLETEEAKAWFATGQARLEAMQRDAGAGLDVVRDGGQPLPQAPAHAPEEIVAGAR